MSMHVGEARIGYVRTRLALDSRHVSLGSQRAMDCIICLIAAPFAVAVGLIIALLIKLDGGTAFYLQRRVGLGGQPFNCLKFRSMVVDADERLLEVLAHDPAARAEWESYQKLTQDPRITP